MEQFNSVDDVLSFAIGEETRAFEFYMELAAKVTNPVMAEALREFAGEEKNHRLRLEGIRKTGRVPGVEQRIADLEIADVMTTVEPGPNMTYQEVLVLAMKKEKAAFAMYTRLAELCTDAKLRQVFHMLAQEEARHKLRFELEYDDVVLKED